MRISDWSSDVCSSDLLDIVSGMHVRLRDIPALAEAADRHGRRLIDVRTPPAKLSVATGRKRGGKRLLTVGTACALGKKYTALALARAFARSEEHTSELQSPMRIPSAVF